MDMVVHHLSLVTSTALIIFYHYSRVTIDDVTAFTVLPVIIKRQWTTTVQRPPPAEVVLLSNNKLHRPRTTGRILMRMMIDEPANLDRHILISESSVNTNDSGNQRNINSNNNINSVIRSLCGPYLIQSIVPANSNATTTTTTTTTTTVYSDDNNNNNNNDNSDDATFQMQYSLIALDDLRLGKDLTEETFATTRTSSSMDNRTSNGGTNTSTSTSTRSAVHAWSTLQQSDYEFPIKTTNDDTMLLLQATWRPAMHHLQIALDTSSSTTTTTTTTKNDTHSEMIAILSRVLVQHTLSIWFRLYPLQQQQQQQQMYQNNNVTIQIGIEATPIYVSLPTSMVSSFRRSDDRSDIDIDNDEYELFVRTLFQGLSTDTSKSELVEMVLVRTTGTHDNNKNDDDDDDDDNNDWEKGNHRGVIGIVPRHWVHQYNLLHRGIGVFVTKDVPISFPSSSSSQLQQPDIYCHQRTKTKRIFPSLYDMFIGGVSIVGESSTVTVLREVSEELGLSTSMMIRPKSLSKRLFQCIICTSYNRCIVDVFGYTVNTATDQIVWQEEEVAWGAFVPYNIVEASALLSIDRLRKDNKWPGRYDIDTSITTSEETNMRNFLDEYDDQWKTWDFVPDGLLVWESWIQELHKSKQ